MSFDHPRSATFLGLAALLHLTLLGSVHLPAQNAYPPFTPNRPSLYWPGTNAGAAPGYFGEWELQNRMPVIPGTNAGLDVNIAGAWSNGFTGQGVIIAIADSGVQGTHPDLNYATNLSWDFNRSAAENLSNAKTLGFPVYPNDTHGTHCAGLAAGTGETFGIVGAAPDAMVASFRYLDRKNSNTSGKYYTDQLIALVLYQGQVDSKGNPDPYQPVNWKNPSWKNGPPIRVKSFSTSVGDAGYQLGVDASGLASLDRALSACSSNGIILVQCSGNSRQENGSRDANRRLVQADPRLLVVGAINSAGTVASYSCFGANLFVVAPSSETDKLHYSIPTTDLIGNSGDNSQNRTNQSPYQYEVFFNTNSGAGKALLDYWSCFGGTSASTPVVAGIMALGIQANPLMTQRLAKYLLALTSRQVDPRDNFFPWITNSAGYRFNNDYGFGLIDASAFTTAAAYAYHYQKNVSNPLSVPQTISVTKDLSKVGAYFATPKSINKSGISASLSLTNMYPKLTTENVEVEVRITGFQANTNDYARGIGAIPGDIAGFLISPSGTTNALFRDDNKSWTLQSRAFDTGFRDSNGVVLDWKFLSYAYWGENPNGKWNLVLYNFSSNSLYTNNLTLESVTLKAGLGSFNTNCLGTNFPFSNGPRRYYR